MVHIKKNFFEKKRVNMNGARVGCNGFYSIPPISPLGGHSPKHLVHLFPHLLISATGNSQLCPSLNIVPSHRVMPCSRLRPYPEGIPQPWLVDAGSRRPDLLPPCDIIMKGFPTSRASQAVSWTNLAFLKGKWVPRQPPANPSAYNSLSQNLFPREPI